MKTEDREELRRATRKMADVLMMAATGCVIGALLYYLVHHGVNVVAWLLSVSVFK